VTLVIGSPLQQGYPFGRITIWKQTEEAQLVIPGKPGQPLTIY